MGIGELCPERKWRERPNRTREKLESMRMSRAIVGRSSGALRPPRDWGPGQIGCIHLDLTDPELVVAEGAATGALVLSPPTGVEVAPAGSIAVAVPEVVVDVVPANTHWGVA